MDRHERNIDRFESKEFSGNNGGCLICYSPGSFHIVIDQKQQWKKMIYAQCYPWHLEVGLALGLVLQGDPVTPPSVLGPHRREVVTVNRKR
jgi:hypothetical protein